MAKRGEYLVGLDIGTSCVTVVVADDEGERLEVIGVGTSQSGGLRKGVIISIDSTVEAIARAIHEAEVMASCDIHSVLVGVSGDHVRGCNSHGVVAVKNGEVAASDVTRVLDAARAIALPQEQRVVRILPQQFVLDGQERITEPMGMNGVRLEAHVHVVSAALNLMENVERCCKRAGLHVTDLVPTPLASAEAVLGEEEKELGVALVDLGAGTTDLLVFCQGSLAHTAVLSIGGYHVTNDLAAGLRTSYREAELLKRRYGCARARDVKAEEQVEVPGIGGGAMRMMPRRALGEIIEARMEEIFQMVRRQLERTGFEAGLPCGVVITGGGARLEGCADLAQKIFGMPVRIGKPYFVGGLPEVTGGPEFSAAVGLVQLGRQPRGLMEPANGHGVLGRARGWLRDFF